MRLCARCWGVTRVQQKCLKCLKCPKVPKIAEGRADGPAVSAIPAADQDPLFDPLATDRYAQMLGYALDSTRCRREQLLGFLGQEPASCSGCDVCTGGLLEGAEGEAEIMGFISRNHRRFTRLQAVKLLRGGRSYEAVTGGLAACPDFGALSDWQEEEIEEVIKQERIAEDVIETEEEIIEVEPDITEEVSTQIEYLPQHKISKAPELPVTDIKSKIEYPSMARRQGIEGIVYLLLYIDQYGKIRNIEILQDPGSAGGPDAFCTNNILDCQRNALNRLPLATSYQLVRSFTCSHGTIPDQGDIGRNLVLYFVNSIKHR